MENNLAPNTTGQTLTLKPTVYYEIDFETVETVEDVTRILKALNITFSEWAPGIDDIRVFLKEKKTPA
jgi:hypothetical protein